MVVSVAFLLTYLTVSPKISGGPPFTSLPQAKTYYLLTSPSLHIHFYMDISSFWGLVLISSHVDTMQLYHFVLAYPISRLNRLVLHVVVLLFKKDGIFPFSNHQQQSFIPTLLTLLIPLSQDPYPHGYLP